MRKAIGTMILLAASAAALITPAMAADRDQRGFDHGNRANGQTGYVSNRGRGDRRAADEFRRDDGRGRNTRARNDRYQQERDRNAWRSRLDRDFR